MTGLLPHEEKAFRDLLRKMCANAGITPIPAICTGPKKHEWIDGNGNGAIRAPSLKNCMCFHCGKPLKPHPAYAQLQPTDTAKSPKRPRKTVQLEMFRDT